MRGNRLLQIWFVSLVLVFTIGAIFNVPWLIAFTAAVAAVLFVSDRWRIIALKDVKYQRFWHYRRGFPGETLDLRIQIQNQKTVPLTWLRSSDTWPLVIAPQDESVLGASHLPQQGTLVHVTSLNSHQTISRPYSLLLRQRGIHQVGPVLLESGDGFGLFEAEIENPDQDYVVVFPELLSPSDFPMDAEDPFGDRRARRRLFEDPNRPMGVREYRPEDGFRRIHWPATARTGSLQTRVFQPVNSQHLVLCLNASTSDHPWLDTDAEMLEQLVKVTATLAYQSFQTGYSVGLISNGCIAHSDQPFRIPPNRTPGQLARLLQALAGVTSFRTGLFEAFLAQSLPSLPYGASLVLVTAYVSQNLAETILRMKRYRSYITLVSLDSLPPPELPGIRAVHLPFCQEPAHA